MKEQVKKLWTDALRSGQHKQGYGRLRNADGSLCCFGVLETLAIESGVRVGPIDIDQKYCRDEVVEWAGLPESNAKVPHEQHDAVPLAAINDSKEYDFNYIADRIEKYL